MEQTGGHLEGYLEILSDNPGLWGALEGPGGNLEVREGNLRALQGLDRHLEDSDRALWCPGDDGICKRGYNTV